MKGRGSTNALLEAVGLVPGAAAAAAAAADDDDDWCEVERGSREGRVKVVEVVAASGDVILDDDGVWGKKCESLTAVDREDNDDDGGNSFDDCAMTSPNGQTNESGRP